jgi:hypothetical protein
LQIHLWKWDIPKAARVLMLRLTLVWSKKDMSRMQGDGMKFVRSIEKIDKTGQDKE